MRRHPLAVALALIVTLLSSRAAAEPEPPIRLTVPTTVSDGAGHELGLPPGYFLTEDTWGTLDTELRRLQEHETRLSAENESLRASTAPPRWWWVAVGVAAGAAVGFVAGRL